MRLLEVEDLRTWFPVRRGLLGRPALFRAVDGVSFWIDPGETLALVGESGSGKTTLGRSVLRLIEPTSGQIRFDGQDVLALGARSLRRLRSQLQIVFQDPDGSLNPRLRVETLVGEAMGAHGIAHGAEQAVRVRALLERVGLDASTATRRPRELSGGQRQRIGIARALALDPRLVVLDEPTSALDVSVQAQIINLLAALQRERGLAYLFITHDLALVRHLAQRVAVMLRGRLVESGPTQAVLGSPAHPYTRALLAAIPPRPPGARDTAPEPAPVTRGCAFHARCPLATERCRVQEPPRVALTGRHTTWCHEAG